MNTKIIKLDINKNLYDTLTAKQGDTQSRFLLFQLLDGAIPFSLENRSVKVFATKPDGKEVFNDLIINDRVKGYCTLELTNQMLAVPGLLKLELMVIEGDKKLTTNVFYMDVKKSINSENAIVSTNEFSALLNGLASLNEYDNYKNEIAAARDGEVNLLTKVKKIDEQLDDMTTEFIDVKKFGVIGDGITDDTVAMQNALNHGGNLFVGAGTYLLSGELKFKSNTFLKGVYGKTIFQKKEAKYIREADNKERWTVLALIGHTGSELACENVTIENIIFDGNSGRENEEYIKPEYGDAQSGAKLIDVINADNITIKNVVSRNNNYLGSAFTSCSNVIIENFKSLNCDVGICIFKDDKTNRELKNYTFKNIFIDGHDMSEGISFYNKSYIKNVKVSDVTILNKEKGTALMIGTEYDMEAGVIDGQFNNITIKKSAVGLAIKQYSNNNQLTNINIENCKQGFLIAQYSNNNNVNNVNISNINSNGFYIGTDAYSNLCSNINLKNCNTDLVQDYKGYITINGNNNTIKNSSVTDNTGANQYPCVIKGNNNNVEIDINKESTYSLTVYVDTNSQNNNVKVSSKDFIKMQDKKAGYTSSITNKLNLISNNFYVKGLSADSISLNDTIYDKYNFSVNSNVVTNLKNITLFEEYRKIYVTLDMSKAGTSVTLSNEGNIIWKSLDTFTSGNNVNFELICLNNKWVELNRW